MSFDENLKGKTFAFTTFSPFKSFWGRAAEILVLIGARRESIQRDVRELEFLHFAHFARVTPSALRRAGLGRDDTLRNGGFLFNSAYNGDAEVYFRAFSEKLTDPMNLLWGSSVGWKSASPYANLDEFITRYQRVVNTHVNTYPTGAKVIRAALTTKDDIDELTTHALSTMDDAEFAKRFERRVMTLWGNAP